MVLVNKRDKVVATLLKKQPGLKFMLKDVDYDGMNVIYNHYVAQGDSEKADMVARVIVVRYSKRLDDKMFEKWLLAII